MSENVTMMADDAERKREHGDGGEARIAAQRAEAVADVSA